MLVEKDSLHPTPPFSFFFSFLFFSLPLLHVIQFFPGASGSLPSKYEVIEEELVRGKGPDFHFEIARLLVKIKLPSPGRRRKMQWMGGVRFSKAYMMNIQIGTAYVKFQKGT